MCVDSRDKVFGLYSLAAPCCQEAMAIDYSKSTYTVCREPLQHYFLLHHAQSDSLLSSPDWSDVIERSQLAHRLLCGITSNNPSQSVEVAGKPAKLDNEDLELIMATGNIRGQISHATLSLEDLSESDLYGPSPFKYKICLSDALMDHMDYISRSATSLRPLSTLHDVCTIRNHRPFAKSISSTELLAPTPPKEW
jgi:hypothetical protein